jgi:hypothetical protein
MKTKYRGVGGGLAGAIRKIPPMQRWKPINYENPQASWLRLKHVPPSPWGPIRAEPLKPIKIISEAPWGTDGTYTEIRGERIDARSGEKEYDLNLKLKKGKYVPSMPWKHVTRTIPRTITDKYRKKKTVYDKVVAKEFAVNAVDHSGERFKRRWGGAQAVHELQYDKRAKEAEK